MTHLAIDGFLPLYDRLDRSHVGHDLPQLEASGLTTALIAHGSDVRDPDVHMDRRRFSYFRESPDDWVDGLRRTSAVNRRTARESGSPVFVSTPDLLIDLPHATWLPVVIDVDEWSRTTAPFESRRLRILHVPSRRVPPIKGSLIVDEVLSALHQARRIDYIAPNQVSNAAMRDLVASADVVVDQILSGSYGVAAVEAMAAGRLVVGDVATDVRARMPADPPIIDANPATFREVISDIIDDPRDFFEQRDSGPKFARTWHDGRASAGVLGPYLGFSG